MDEQDMDERLKKVVRLALRHEGTMWNAYFALPDSMEGAVLLGSISMRLVAGSERRRTAFRNEQRRMAFMALMREAVSDLLEESVGWRPETDGFEAAPEHERGGNA